MATRTLYLVRHGEYHWNTDPSPWKGLTRLGVQQARRTAKRLSAIPVTSIYCSHLTRAVETAAHIAKAHDGVAYQPRRILRECWLPGAGRPRPRRVDKAEARRRDAVFQRFVRPARGHDKHEIIVSHGNLIRYLVCRVLTATEDPHWFRMKTLNCAISKIVVGSDGRAALVSYNDVGHLPAHLVTTGLPAQPMR